MRWCSVSWDVTSMSCWAKRETRRLLNIQVSTLRQTETSGVFRGASVLAGPGEPEPAQPLEGKAASLKPQAQAVLYVQRLDRKR